MSFGRTELGPEAETQELMTAFGTFIETKHGGDLEALSTCEEEIFSFEVEWNDLCADPIQFFITNTRSSSLNSFSLTLKLGYTRS